jgi:glycine/D-amino acid oxidase-like deaminating enzyme
VTEIIVVGAGIVGSAIAYRFACAGARVTVFDTGDRTPTTATSFAWTNSNGKQPLAYHALNVAGMGEHLALEMELGESRFHHHVGNVEWAIGEDEHQRILDKVARLQGWAYPAEIIDRATLQSIDPALIPPDGAEAIAFYPSEGYVDAVPLAAELLERAHAAGATVHIGKTVAAVGPRVVSLSDGMPHQADIVICAAGRWTGALVATAGFDIPMAPTRSCLGLTTPAPRLRTMLLSTAINLRPDGTDRMLLQNTKTDLQGDDPTPTIAKDKLDDLLLAPARKVVRGFAGVQIENAKLGIRAIPADGHPVVGPVPDCEGLYVVCSHSGVTLAPFFARAVMREVLHGETEHRLASFRPERFCTTTTSS